MSGTAIQIALAAAYALAANDGDLPRQFQGVEWGTPIEMTTMPETRLGGQIACIWGSFTREKGGIATSLKGAWSILPSTSTSYLGGHQQTHRVTGAGDFELIQGSTNVSARVSARMRHGAYYRIFTDIMQNKGSCAAVTSKRIGDETKHTVYKVTYAPGAAP